MTLQLDLQLASDAANLPTQAQIETWLRAALEGHREDAELTIRIVDREEGTSLNEYWRKRQGPTNVLSFPATDEKEFIPDLLGDIIVCAPVVEQEAADQDKPLDAHWAHLVVHGLLHLLGYDHLNDEQAQQMESIETGILAKLNYADPYNTVGK